ncbi:MAG: class I SAM-dependent methyltransferase [Desulfobacteraceae bacterium]|nr:class I SAM-dependent methyltransferase [Desulfobacteraceae bacterium]
MASVKEHYDSLLASCYSWMCGGSDLKLKENRAFFRDHGIRPALSAAAVDLGSGAGFQTIPLAEAGFEVTAIDVSSELLAQLKQTAGKLPIRTVQADLLNFTEYSPEKIELIVCMGDTLTHLKVLADVKELIHRVYGALAQGGLLILGFRDMTVELTQLDRFIPVRSDSKRIFTCFLEYEKNHVKVHDIVYEKTDDQWKMKNSYFRKLRISSQWVREHLSKAGFQVEEVDTANGMITIFARKVKQDA